MMNTFVDYGVMPSSEYLRVTLREVVVLWNTVPAIPTYFLMVQTFL